MNSLYDFHDKWEDILEKSNSDGNDALTEHEKVWFNIQSLVQAVNGRGLIDYYSNKEADTVDDCVRALEVIGAFNTRRLVERVNDLFENGVPKDIDERNMEMENWSTTNCAVLNDFEIDYFAQEEDVEGLLVNFIVETGIGS